MRRKMHISKIGLKLIKAYEGYRPVDRHLVNGHHVVGYGHIIDGDDSLVLTRPEAEDLLRRDLEPYEDMINETVHAPLSQSQYDALVSLAFNIGPRAFTQSDTLRALNNGRPLDAASGFDIWRKSTIDGKTYVVDALMRRRAAEKALFLRTEGKKTLPASRADLPPERDEMVALLTTEDALPVVSNDARNGIVARVPYEADEMFETGLEGQDVSSSDTDEYTSEGETSSYVTLAAPEAYVTQDDSPMTYARRREDGPSGILELSEVYDDDQPRVPNDASYDDLIDDTYEVDDFDGYESDIGDTVADTSTPEGSTRIADTASKISDRLDALIDNVASDDGFSDSSQWPETLIQTADMTENSPQAADTIEKPADIVIDNLIEDDAFRERTDSASKYINIEPPKDADVTKERDGYLIPLFIGMCLTAASAGAIFGNPAVVFGKIGPRLSEWGPLLSFVGLTIGIVMTIFTVFYALKAKNN